MAILRPRYAPVYEYSRSSQRWTWRNQEINGVTVLSRKRVAPNGNCAYYAVVAALEANLRARGIRIPDLSVKYLRMLDDELRDMDGFRGYPKVRRIMEALRRTGVASESYYRLFDGGRTEIALHATHYRIRGYRMYHVGRYGDIRRALRTHLRAGPMVAVFKISSNYERSMRDGRIYRYIKDSQVEDEDLQLVTHAVSVVGFGICSGVPYLLFQVFHKGNYMLDGKVDFHSVIELYGFDF